MDDGRSKFTPFTPNLEGKTGKQKMDQRREDDNVSKKLERREGRDER